MLDSVVLNGSVSIPVPETGFDAVGAGVVIVCQTLLKGSQLLKGETVEVTWAGWTTDIAESMVGKPIAGELDDGRYAIVEPSAFIDIKPTAVAQTANFCVETLRIYNYRPPGHGVKTWMFCLLNFQMKSGDLLVDESHADGRGSWGRDTIKFQYADREWYLRDELRDKDDKELREFRKQDAPLISGTLWTEWHEADEAGTVDLLAMQLCNILSFATERSVRWWERCLIDATGELQGSLRPFPWSAAARDGGNGPIETLSTGSLSAFVTRAGRVVAQDPDWWNRTMELHLQGVLSPIIDVRLTFFYVLLDRISSRVVAVKEPFQIAADLKEKLDDGEWQARLTALFGELTDNWSEDRTKAIVGTVKGWNATPSFVKRVKLAATTLGLPEPHGQVVKERNLLVHDGNVPSKMPDGIRHLGDFSRAVEALVTAMLLRMLDHEDDAYLPDAGRDYRPIHPWPDDRVAPWSPASNEEDSDGS